MSLRHTLLAVTLLAATTAAASAQVVFGPLTNPGTNHRYYIVRIANYADYALAAQNLGGYPVVINDAYENEFLRVNIMPHIPVPFDHAYIGYSDPSATGTYKWSAGVIDSYTNWNAGEPNNAGGIEHYATMRPDGTWNDQPAPPPDSGTGLSPAIVEVNNNGGPTGIGFGPVVSPGTGSVFYVTTAAVWYYQQRFAIDTLGGYVASISNAAEQSWIANNLLQISNLGSTLSIGLNANNSSSPGFYSWGDNLPITYTHWAPGEPNNISTEPIGVMSVTGASAGFWQTASDAARPALIKIKRCPADFNKSGTLEVQDIFDFLNAWFAGCP